MLAEKSVRSASIVALPAAMMAASDAEVFEREGSRMLSPDSTLFPGQIAKVLYKPNSACAAGKLDLWAQNGAYTLAIFVVGRNTSDRMDYSGDDNEATIMIGSEGCRIRVRIDRGD